MRANKRRKSLARVDLQPREQDRRGRVRVPAGAVLMGQGMGLEKNPVRNLVEGI